MKDISVIIPIKDEPYIPALVRQIHKTLSSLDHEIIIVDESYEPLNLTNAKVIRQKSHGLGNAFVEGFRESKGKYIVLMDGDGQHRPEDIPKMLSALDSADFVIGSKLLKGSRVFYSENRFAITKLLGWVASVVLSLNIKDNMSGFSAMKRSAISKIHLNPLGYKINLEVAYKLNKKGFKLAEVPIIFLERRKGETKVGFNLNGLLEAFNVLRLIIELRLGVR